MAKSKKHHGVYSIKRKGKMGRALREVYCWAKIMLHELCHIRGGYGTEANPGAEGWDKGAVKAEELECDLYAALSLPTVRRYLNKVGKGGMNNGR